MSHGTRPPGVLTKALAVGLALVVLALPGLGLFEAILREPASLSSKELGRALPMLRDSLILSLAVAASSTLLGAWLAWVSDRLRYPGRAVLAVAALLPLATPSYLLAAAADRTLFSPLGPLSSLRGLVAAWIVLTVVTAPVVQLVVSSALARSSASEEEAARSLGTGRLGLLRVVVLPRVQASLVFGFVLSFVYALSDFGAVAVLDVPVLTFRLYQAVAAHEIPRATLYGGLLLAAAIPTLVLAGWLRGRGLRGVANPRSPARLKAGPFEGGLAVGAQVLVAGLGLALPVFELGRWVLAGLISPELSFAPILTPVLHTVAIAALGAVLTVLIALPVAWVSARARRFGLLRQGAWLASALPGPLLAFGWILIALLGGRLGLFGYGALLSSGLLLILGYATRFLAEAGAPLEDGILHLDPRQEAAARSLGASRSRWMSLVVGPALLPGLATALVLAFIAILKELPVTLLLGSPAGLSTLAFRVFDRYNEAVYHDAGLAGLFLLAATLLALTLTLKRR